MFCLRVSGLSILQGEINLMENERYRSTCCTSLLMIWNSCKPTSIRIGQITREDCVSCHTQEHWTLVFLHFSKYVLAHLPRHLGGDQGALLIKMKILQKLSRRYIKERFFFIFQSVSSHTSRATLVGTWTGTRVHCCWGTSSHCFLGTWVKVNMLRKLSRRYKGESHDNNNNQTNM